MAKLRLNQEMRGKLKVWFASRIEMPAEEKALTQQAEKIKRRITDEINRWLDKYPFDRAELKALGYELIQTSKTAYVSDQKKGATFFDYRCRHSLAYEGKRTNNYGLLPNTRWTNDHWSGSSRANIRLEAARHGTENSHYTLLPIDREVPKTDKFMGEFQLRWGYDENNQSYLKNEWITKTTARMIIEQIAKSDKVIEQKIELFNTAAALIDRAKTYEDLCEVWPEARLAASEVAPAHNPNPLSTVGDDQIEALKANGAARGIRSAA